MKRFIIFGPEVVLAEVYEQLKAANQTLKQNINALEKLVQQKEEELKQRTPKREKNGRFTK